MERGRVTPTWRFNGLRGRYLVFKGVLYVAIGLTYIVPTALPSTERSLDFLLRFGLPVAVAGIPWLLGGIAAIVGAFRSPPGRDGWAFQVLVILAAAWSLIYLFSWIFGASPRGYFLAIVFAALAGGSFTVASMVSVGEMRAAMERRKGIEAS